MRRLLPDPGPTTVDEVLAGYRPYERPHQDRPFVAVNFATTLDGRASIDGRSGQIGSKADTEMLMRLRTRFDAVMIGAGTMRAERYGRMIPNPERRARRERIGLPHDPLAVIISGRLDLPWDAPLFTDGGGRILLFTNSREEPPETATSLRCARIEGEIKMADVLAHLRNERGIRAVLCEGGPRVHGQLEAGGLVDELFLTIAPRLSGGDAPRIIEGALSAPVDLKLLHLLETDGELLARYGRG